MSFAFPDPETAAALAARMLLEIEAVNFRADEPYIFTSGLAAPVYVDCRKPISFPRVRSALMDMAAGRALSAGGFEKFDAVAGGETAGIPWAAMIAERLGLPMLYVRKKPKGFGRGAQIEGHFEEGANVLLVEDLTTDGGSKFTFADALRTAGAQCTDTLVIFYYDIFPDARANLAAHGLALHQLTTWRDVLAVARTGDHLGRTFDAKTLDAVEAFLNDPYGWSAAHGGKAGPD
ncbi:orotate phosphoribosyltransferase [Albimonas pacifica]|uniref:Orotate phosphoribosyltransferase n=1 Tax=Albimonas pacifica TaxID=1114924 RepID=A0A1I3EM71_9RHOB|nr:orotate phosphoribosyltransferase [Albimonas pacifica]SFI00076.1 orotate phosphoribosyltransferase [Albimonas pacifica]